MEFSVASVFLLLLSIHHQVTNTSTGIITSSVTKPFFHPRSCQFEKTTLLCQVHLSRNLSVTCLEFRSVTNVCVYFRAPGHSRSWEARQACLELPSSAHSFVTHEETYQLLKTETYRRGGGRPRAHHSSSASQAGYACSEAHCCSAEPWFRVLRVVGGGDAGESVGGTALTHGLKSDAASQ